MPTSPSPPCRSRLCPHVQPCPIHGARNRDLNKRTWRRLSRWQLTREPLCADCLAEGQTTPADDPHHVERRDEGGPLLTDRLVSLCKSHHAKRTAEGQ